MRLAIVPALNEESKIGSVVQNLFSHVDHVVVVDDGSRDKTIEKAKAAGAVVLEHIINRGQGAALQTGHEYAMRLKADVVVHFDGDDQFDVEDVTRGITLLEENHLDIVIGKRIHSLEYKLPAMKRYVIWPGAKLVNRILGGITLSDSHCGFRVIRGTALPKLRITQDRMAHASEIPVLVGRAHLRYGELPIHVTYHRYGQRFFQGFKVLRDLFFGRFSS